MKIFTTAHPSALVALVGGTCMENVAQMLELGGDGDRPRPARARRFGQLARWRPRRDGPELRPSIRSGFRPSDAMPLRRPSRAVAWRVAP